MIQDIGNYKYDNAYHPIKPDQDCYVMHYEKRKMLVKKEGEDIDFPRFRDLEEQNPNIYQDAIYLFKIDEMRFYLVNALQVPGMDQDERADSALTDMTEKEHCVYEMLETMEFRGAKPRYLAFAGITGYQLFQWYGSRRFCGRCGSRMRHDEKERMMYCDQCHQMEFPKICPAVIVGVKDGNRLLMTKYAGRTFKKYALIAGFCEIGETVEETVQREVMEEVGLKVKNIQYYKSQPWSFSDTLLMGFMCDLEEPGEIHLDENELAVAEWFEREDIPLDDPTKAALTQEMILMFKEGKL